ncbi:beta-ketoacyl synthase chain length factor [soil metagenome]
MKPKIYINGLASISAQVEEAVFNGNAKEYHQNIIPAIEPFYKDFIPVISLRRMSKAVKMGLTAAKMALKEAGDPQPDAILTGTGQGNKQDTERFLEDILEQKEELVAPTAFIQSTHNTVGGQIGLNLKNKSYNTTYSHTSSSLEAAFIDALLLYDEKSAINVLVGGVDDISEKITSFQYLDSQIKNREICNLDLFHTSSPGTIISEGAHFFCLSSQKESSSYSRLLDVLIFNAGNAEDVSDEILRFLKNSDIDIGELDVVILGKNGDSRFDHFYEHLQENIFAQKQQLGYKHLSGDYNTSSGYAIWLGCKILKDGFIPEILKLNNMAAVSNPANILIYNQYLGVNHSIILLGSP